MENLKIEMSRSFQQMIDSEAFEKRKEKTAGAIAAGYTADCQDRYGVGSHVGVLDKTTKWGATMYKRGRLYVGIPLTR